MENIIVHLCLGVICGIFVYVLTLKLEFSLAIFLGNLLPDFVNLSGTYAYTGFVSFAEAVKTEVYLAWLQISHNLGGIIGFWLVVLSLVWMLYRFHLIDKKEEKRWQQLVILLLIGAIIHVLVDIFLMRF